MLSGLTSASGELFDLWHGTEVSPGKFCIDVPAAAVRRVIFGCRTSPDLEREIRASVTSNPSLTHVTFARTTLVPGGKIMLVDSV